MALTPYLAALGGTLGQLLEKSDTKALQPKEEETKVCGGVECGGVEGVLSVRRVGEGGRGR